MSVLMCVPNISEGKDLKNVEEIVEQIRNQPGVKLLDYSSDEDHNRSVLTYLGQPEAVLAATQNMAAKALELIEMSKHKGSHPRMGAVDVVPFIPIRDIETDDAVDIAHQFGRFLGERGVPVYFYEDAAVSPERKSLVKIRQGEYEGLPEKLQDPAWKPDAGPAKFNPKSGATVTGSRLPLVAFNVNLRTNELAVAQRIARAVRHINGGYRYVRAIGLALEDQGMVQVSMNLTNYTKTPIPRVLETIRFEAARHGVSVAGTEIIGPMPLGAMEEIMKHYLQTHDFTLDQLIETALI